MRDQDQQARQFQKWLEEQGPLPVPSDREAPARVANTADSLAKDLTELPWWLVAGDGGEERAGVWLMLRG